MKAHLQRWFKGFPFSRTKGFERFLDRVVEMLKIPAPDTPQLLYRIRRMERDIILPIKAAGIAMLLSSFYHSPWIGMALGELDIAVESTQYFLWLYIGANAVVAGLLLAMDRLPPALLEWSVFTISLVDGIFLSALMLVTGGADSMLYWLFLGLIVRSAASVPRATSQLMLNLTLSACYLLAGTIYINVAESLNGAFVASSTPATAAGRITATDRIYDDSPTATITNRALTRARAAAARGGQAEPPPLLDLPEHPIEHLLLRLMLLLLLTLCAYAVQVLLERQRQALEQAREFGMREGQLRSAGRLAAEFAHQIKNPLAIITNAAFSLQRALKEGKPVATEQLQIIQEEVQRSDRIITEIMGYAQLSEGRVEKLSVTEELDRAIAQVFPSAAQYPIQIHRDYAGHFPPLLMQRRHVSETLVNLLQNAREALDGHGGNVFVQAQCCPDYSIEVSIRDDGPGIPPEKQQKIFEAYYTSKEKGTGLGLATVKHNVELYGGSVRVESELGKGARFILLFPGRTLLKLTAQT